MGCVSSSSTKVPHRPSTTARRQSDLISKTPVRVWDRETVLGALMENVDTIQAFPEEVPILGFTSHVIPLFTIKLDFDEIGSTNIQLPILSVVPYEQGIICCWSHKNFGTGTNANVKQFFRNLMGLAKRGSFVFALLLLEMPKEMMKSFDVFVHMGSTVDVGGFNARFEAYTAIAISSDIDLKDEARIDKLEQFVAQGGVLLVACHNRTDDTFGITEEPVNVLLQRHGLAFARFSIGHENDKREIVVSKASNDGSGLGLQSIAAKYKELLEQDDIDVDTLDDVVTALRCYSIVCRAEDMIVLQSVAFHSFKFIASWDMREDGMLYPDVIQRLVLVAIAETITAMRQYRCGCDTDFVAPYVDMFPGMVENAKLDDFELTVNLDTQRLISTGFWCVAGQQCEISVESFPEALLNNWVSVQIGSHSADLLVKPGPWRRMPNVVLCFDFKRRTVHCGSPFGGIVYINVQDLPHSEACSVNLKITNVCQYPFYNVENPDSYELTKDCAVPWGELMGRRIIFTARTEDIHKIPDIDRAMKFYDDLIENMAAMMNYELLRRFRVVFDVDTITPRQGEMVNSYPIVVMVEEFDDLLLNIHKPTTSLFFLISTMARLCLVEGCHDELTETALAATVGSCMLCQLFPEFDPLLDIDAPLPLLFPEFWQIQRWCNPTAIWQVIRSSQNPRGIDGQADDVDMWVKFITQLCTAGRTNYSEIFDKKRVVPLNAVTAVHCWPNPVFSTTMYSVPSSVNVFV